MRCCCGRQVSLETLVRIRPKSKLRAAATWLGTPTSYRTSCLAHRRHIRAHFTWDQPQPRQYAARVFDYCAITCLELRSHSTCDTSTHSIYANDSVFHMAMLTVG